MFSSTSLACHLWEWGSAWYHMNLSHNLCSGFVPPKLFGCTGMVIPCLDMSKYLFGLGWAWWLSSPGTETREDVEREKLRSGRKAQGGQHRNLIDDVNCFHCTWLLHLWSVFSLLLHRPRGRESYYSPFLTAEEVSSVTTVLRMGNPVLSYTLKWGLPTYHLPSCPVTDE